MAYARIKDLGTKPMDDKAIQFTYQDYLLFPHDLKIHQIIEGEHYVNPSPIPYHQAISRNLIRILAEFVERNDLGEVFQAPIDVVLSDTDVLVPDLIFISRARSAIIEEKYVAGAPDLVIEILSHGTKSVDQGLKSKVYAKFGVTEYWIVDPKKKTVKLYRLNHRRYREHALFTHQQELTTPTFPGLRVRLAEIFRR